MKTFHNSRFVIGIDSTEEESHYIDKWQVVGIKGDKWHSMKPVIWMGDLPEEHRLRYRIEKGIIEDISFMYRITGKTTTTLIETSTFHGHKIRCEIWIPDKYNFEKPFKGWLVLKRIWGV